MNENIQLFHRIMILPLYLDKEKKNVYNFNSLDTMRYQGYYLEITNGIPNTLYCEFYENY